MKDVRVYAHAAALAWAAASCFVSLAVEAQAARGRFVVALAGGSTPEAAYELLAGEAFFGGVDWSRVQVLFGDERAVPPDHVDSNYRMARETLLARVPIPGENVHRIQGEREPAEAARRYQIELETVLGENGRFDLIFLGMGSDGHTASLFPGTPALEERERLVVANPVRALERTRITLTLPAINAARQVVFLVSGASKAAALAAVLAGEPLPAARVLPEDGQVTWLVDRDARAASRAGTVE